MFFVWVVFFQVAASCAYCNGFIASAERFFPVASVVLWCLVL